MNGYMGVFVEEDSDENRACATCAYGPEVDRHECNECANRWLVSQMKLHTGWAPKQGIRGSSS
jgi:hypothetical protein